MRGYVTRTFIKSTINASVVKVENGTITTTPLTPITVDGKVTSEKAVREVKKANKIKGNVIVNVEEIIENSFILGVPVEKFMKIAEEIKEEPVVEEN